MSSFMERPETVSSLQKLGITQKVVESFTSSKQSFRKAYLLVSSGDVSQLEVDKETENLVTITGYIHSEKTAALFYKASITIASDSGIPVLRNYTCTCKGSSELIVLFSLISFIYL